MTRKNVQKKRAFSSSSPIVSNASYLKSLAETQVTIKNKKVNIKQKFEGDRLTVLPSFKKQKVRMLLVFLNYLIITL